MSRIFLIVLRVLLSVRSKSTPPPPPTPPPLKQDRGKKRDIYNQKPTCVARFRYLGLSEGPTTVSGRTSSRTDRPGSPRQLWPQSEDAPRRAGSCSPGHSVITFGPQASNRNVSAQLQPARKADNIQKRSVSSSSSSSQRETEREREGEGEREGGRD